MAPETDKNARSCNPSKEASKSTPSCQLLHLPIVRVLPQPPYLPSRAERTQDRLATLTLRKRRLQRRALLKDQTSRGRYHPLFRWCPFATCRKELFFVQTPEIYLGFRAESRIDIPYRVDGCISEFINVMLDKLYPETRDDPRDRMRHYRYLDSFICSPPLRLAVCRFLSYIYSNGVSYSRRAFLQAMQQAVAHFANLYEAPPFAVIVKIHVYLEPWVPESQTLCRMILQFIVRANLWRKYDDARAIEWAFGGTEIVGELLAAILYHFWLMDEDDCFFLRTIYDDEQWDGIWEDWLSRYPRFNDDDLDESFVFRVGSGETGERTLELAGYLGGRGTLTSSTAKTI